MGTVMAFIHVTLDGVMQGPGREDEDHRGSFTSGGWGRGGNDPVMGSFVAAGMARTTALLLGRRTYESFFAFWPDQPQPNPFTSVLDNSRKFVASRTLKAPLAWKNSTLLEGDACEAVATLKRDPAMNLLILGSGELTRSLFKAGLVDELLLMIHPRVLGTGRKLFGDDGVPSNLQLIETKPTTTGVIIASYRPRLEKAS